MRLSAQGLDLIKRSEGFRASVYNDPAGVPTIGYGHKIRPGEAFAPTITDTQATAILLEDVSGAEEAVTRLVKVPLTQGQFDALVDFTYNLGMGRLAQSTLLRELNAGNFAAAADEFLKWDHISGHESAGLKARRQAERDLFAGVAGQ